MERLDACELAPWGEAEARRWWHDAAPGVRQRLRAASAARSQSPAPPTLAVDYARRASEVGPEGSSLG